MQLELVQDWPMELDLEWERASEESELWQLPAQVGD